MNKLWSSHALVIPWIKLQTVPIINKPHTFLITGSRARVSIPTFSIVNNWTLIGDLMINMKSGQYDTFVLDVPHRSAWSVYKYLSRNTAPLWLIACQNVGFLQRHCQKIKIITYAKAGMIKSDSPTSRTSDFWGQTSKNLPFSSPRTTGFFQSTCPKLLSLKCQKVLFPVNSYYLLPVNPDVWSPSWLFCGGKAWHLFLKDFTHFCATSFYPFVLLLILVLKGLKKFSCYYTSIQMKCQGGVVFVHAPRLFHCPKRRIGYAHCSLTGNKTTKL